jgi:dolichol kinase
LTNSPDRTRTETYRSPDPLADGDSYRIELIRKSIHLCSLSIPIFYFHTPRIVALGVLIPLTLAFVIIDVGRYYHRPIETWFYRTFGWLLRTSETSKEKKRLNGATYVLIAATLSVLIFPKVIAVTSFVILIIADLAAALIGKRFGRHRFLGKSLEGSAGFLLSALVVVAILPKVDYQFGEYAIGGAAALAGAIVEALPIDIDDNLSIPLVVGTVMWAGYQLFYPFLDINTFG